MRKLAVALLLFFSIFLHIHWRDGNGTSIPPEFIRPWLLNELSRTWLFSLSEQNWRDRQSLQQLYHESRKHYKKVEFFIEYCSPREAKSFINGPLVPKSDLELSNEVIPPQGFQRIEELLFTDDSLDSAAIHAEFRLLFSRLMDLYDYYKHIEINNGQLLEMCQIQLYRIVSLNLSGYDATISQTNVTESYWCMEGLEQVIQQFGQSYVPGHPELKPVYTAVLKQLSRSKKFLHQHTDYNTFNRLDFIVNYITPLNAAIIHFHESARFPWSNRIQAINLKKEFLFGKKSLNAQYFSMYYDDTVNIGLQAQLGKILFFDPILSGNNKSSCASCHTTSKAFTDGYVKGLDFEKQNVLPRNTPTLLNVIYQKAFFYDGRAYQLEQQIFDVVHNKTEMRSSFTDVIAKLKKDTHYCLLFRKAFQGTPDSVITPYSIQKAIMEYEKTLVSLNSRFDQYLHGDKKKLTAGRSMGLIYLREKHCAEAVISFHYSMALFLPFTTIRNMKSLVSLLIPVTSSWMLIRAGSWLHH